MTVKTASMVDKLRASRAWRSVFRSGTGNSTLHPCACHPAEYLPPSLLHQGSQADGALQRDMVSGHTDIRHVPDPRDYGHPADALLSPLGAAGYYADMKDLQFVVSSGLFLRNLHRWSAQLMVFLVFAHMFKVFYRGAYRTPREFNWVIGVVLQQLSWLLLLKLHRLLVAMGPNPVPSGPSPSVPIYLRRCHSVGNKIHFLLLGGNQVNCTNPPCCAFMFCTAWFFRLRSRFCLSPCTSGAHSQRRRPLRAADRNPSRNPVKCRRHRDGGEMSDPKDFVAGIDSDQRRSPTRVAFVTRRTSAQVKGQPRRSSANVP